MFLEEISEYSLQGLRVFSYVASKGSVAEAARMLRISQPAVTLQIHNLEKTLGFSLFERKGRRNVLTSRGKNLFHKILPELEKLERILTDAKFEEHILRPKLFVGTLQGLGEYWLSRQLGDYTKQSEGIRIFLEFNDSSELEERLLTGQLSVVVTPRKIEKALVVSQVLMEERLVPVARAEEIDRLKKALEKKTRDARFWEDFDWIGFGTTSNSDPWTQRWLESMEVFVDRRFRYAHIVNSFEVIKRMLLQGLGICVAPAHTVEEELRSGELVSLESSKHPALQNRLYISYRDASLNQVHTNFVDWLIKQAGGL